MATPYRVIVSPRAFADLNGILDYVAKDSPQNAAAVVGRLWEAAQSLTAFPHRHRVAAGGRAETRVMPEPPYLIYYRIVEPHHVVRILTVRHGARRQPRRFE